MGKEGNSLKSTTKTIDRPARKAQKVGMEPRECKAIRRALGMTQDEFARAMGLKSWLTVCRWEGGKVVIDDARAYAIHALAKERGVHVRTAKPKVVK